MNTCKKIIISSFVWCKIIKGIFIKSISNGDTLYLALNCVFVSGALFSGALLTGTLLTGCVPSVQQDVEASGSSQHFSQRSPKRSLKQGEHDQASATIGDNRLEVGNTVTSQSLSPYDGESSLVKFPKSEVSLSLDSFKKADSIQRLSYKTGQGLIHGRIFSWLTKNNLKIAVTIGNNGIIYGTPYFTATPKQVRDNESDTYILGEVGNSAEFVDFNPTKGLLGFKNARGIELFSIPEGRILGTLNSLTTRITALKFSPDGESLLISGADSMIYNWRFAAQFNGEESGRSERLLHRYVGAGSIPSALAYHPQGRVFFSGDWRGDLVTWQRYGIGKYEGKYDKNYSGDRFFTGKSIRVRSRVGNGVGIDKLQIDETGQFLFVGLQDGSLEVWKIKGMQPVTSLKVHDGPIYSLSVRGPGTLLATAGKDGHAKVWQMVSTESIVEEEIGQQGRKKKFGAGKKKGKGKNIGEKNIGTMLRKVTLYELKLAKDLSIPGLVTANFIEGVNLLAADKSGKVIEIDVQEMIQTIG